MTGFTIVKMAQGGYVVYPGRGSNESMNYGAGPIFASAKIGEALEFVRQELEKA